MSASSSSSSSSSCSSQRTLGGVPIPDSVVAVDETGHMAAVARVCDQMGVPFLAVAGISHHVETDQERAAREQAEFLQQALAYSASRMTKEDAVRFAKSREAKHQASAVWKAFEEACQRRDWKTVRGMLEKKTPAVSDVRDQESLYQPLHMVARHGGAELVPWMVKELGATVNAESFNGKRPLHYASVMFEATTVEALMAAGADATLLDHAKRSVLEVVPFEHIVELWQHADFRNEIEPKIGRALAPIVGRDPKRLSELPECLRPVVRRVVDEWSKEHNKDKADAKAHAKAEAMDTDMDDGLCTICLSNPADTTVFPCRHCVVCKSCAVGLRATADAKVCVRCRGAIERIED